MKASPKRILTNLALFPPVKETHRNGQAVKSKRDGGFQRFSIAGAATTAMPLEAGLVEAAPPAATALNAMDESSRKSAAVWRLLIPQSIAPRNGLLRVQYFGELTSSSLRKPGSKKGNQKPSSDLKLCN